MSTASDSPWLDAYQIHPYGYGTSEAEAATSVLCAFARAHGKSPLRALELLHTTFSLTFTGLREKDVGCLNGYGVMQARLESMLGMALRRDDLSGFNFGWAARSFSKRGGLVAKPVRHFCSVCFLRMRRAEMRPHDLLAWQVTDLSICVVDRSPLHSRCPGCKSAQSFLPTSGIVDVCWRCGGWLGDAESKPALASDAGCAHQAWLAVEVAKLVEAAPRLRTSLHGEEPKTFVRELIKGRRVTNQSLAEQMNVADDTLRDWRRGRRRPRLAVWMRICAVLGVSPLDTLVDPFLASCQMPLDIDRGSWPVPTWKQLVADPTLRLRIVSAVEEELKLAVPTVTSIAELAERLNSTQASLYHYSNSAVKKLSGRIRCRKTVKKHDVLRSRKRTAERIIRQLERDGEDVTRANFVPLYRQRTDQGEWAAKEMFTDLLRQHRKPDEDGAGLGKNRK
jgi:transcriptional regulator with XRE-family HTH domain